MAVTAATRSVQRPEVRILLGLILVLLPVAVGLAARYGSPVRLEKVMLPLPGDGLLRGHVAEVSQGEVASLRLLHAPGSEPETGIARVYGAPEAGPLRYLLVVMRYRIACQVRKDVMAVGVYRLDESALARVFLTEPWEVKGGPVDTEAFLAQLAGRPLDAPLQGDDGIDGITGATSSSQGLIACLDEAAGWIRQRQAQGLR